MRRGGSGLNLLLGVNKPAGMSSHVVVNRVRRALGERRVGHAGTLDPAATGVLVVGVGQGTRLMGHLTSNTKSYLASIAFGAETNTDDAEGEVVRTADVPAELFDAAYAREVLARFVGPQMQVPPAFSAISVGGKRSYARARAGEEVELEARPVVVESADLIAVVGGEVPCWQCTFVVSKGTYIRALARDMGREVGSAAHLLDLCRTTSGNVTLGMCTSLETLAELGADGVRSVALDPVRALGMPVRELEEREVRFVRGGNTIPSEPGLVPGTSVAVVREGRVLGIWKVSVGGLRPVVNFPDGIEGVRS